MRTLLCFFILRATAFSLYYFVDVSLDPQAGFIFFCLTSGIATAIFKNPNKTLAHKPTGHYIQYTACLCLSNCLFLFPPLSSGSTPSQYAVSVLERKSQIGTSSQRSCCPVQTVEAAVSQPLKHLTEWLFSKLEQR